MTHARRPVRFQPFSTGDAPLLGTWLAGVGLGVPQGVSTTTWARRILQDPGISCWTCRQGRRTVGFFRLDTGPDLMTEITLIVDPAQRRFGIGRLLLDEALNQARSRGLRKMLAVVEAANGEARAFFEDAGFDRVEGGTPGHVHLHRLVHRGAKQPPLEIHP